MTGVWQQAGMEGVCDKYSSHLGAVSLLPSPGPGGLPQDLGL